MWRNGVGTRLEEDSLLFLGKTGYAIGYRESKEERLMLCYIGKEGQRLLCNGLREKGEIE